MALWNGLLPEMAITRIPNQSKDGTILSLVELGMDKYRTISISLGQRVIKIVVGDDEDFNEHSGPDPPSLLTVHELLLCHHSRFFAARLDRPLDKEALAEVLLDVESKQEKVTLYMSRWDNPLLEEKSIPTGYIPSWMTFAYQYRKDAEKWKIPSIDSEPDDIINLPEENPQIFNIFIHWLYTQDLVTSDFGISLSEEQVCLLVYALADRLDVPALRQACYYNIRERYDSATRLPSTRLLETISNDCPAGSKVRKYYVELFAHTLISRTTEENYNSILDFYPEFSAEVTSEVMARLRAVRGSQGPYEDKNFEVDESDSEVEFSSSSGSEMDLGDSASERDEDKYDGEDGDEVDEADIIGPSLKRITRSHATSPEVIDIKNDDDDDDDDDDSLSTISTSIDLSSSAPFANTRSAQLVDRPDGIHLCRVATRGGRRTVYMGEWLNTQRAVYASIDAKYGHVNYRILSVDKFGLNVVTRKCGSVTTTCRLGALTRQPMIQGMNETQVRDFINTWTFGSQG